MTIQARKAQEGPPRILGRAVILAGLTLALLGGAACIGATAHAKVVAKGTAKDRHVMVCASVKGANCVSQPSPDNPVPHWAEPSYGLYLDMKARAHGGTRHMSRNMPDWSGLWQRRGGPKYDAKQPGRLADGRITADLTALGRKGYHYNLERVARGDEYDLSTSCLPDGFPRVMGGLFQYEWADTPKLTWMIYDVQSEVRRIYTDGRGHILEDEAFPLWDGDSIGFWDGDTLVAHTMYVIPQEYTRSQPYYSNRTSTVERIHRPGPNEMQDDMMIWDPVNLARPWHVVQTYFRVTAQDSRNDMWACAENNNTVQTANGGTHIILPGEPGYKKPATDGLTYPGEDEAQNAVK